MRGVLFAEDVVRFLQLLELVAGSAAVLVAGNVRVEPETQATKGALEGLLVGGFLLSCFFESFLFRLRWAGRATTAIGGGGGEGGGCKSLGSGVNEDEHAALRK